MRTLNIEARKSLCEFPLLVSSSISFPLAVKLARSLETRNAILVKLVIERMGLIRLDHGETKDTLIQKVKGLKFTEHEDPSLFLESDEMDISSLSDLLPLFEEGPFVSSAMLEDLDLTGLNLRSINEADISKMSDAEFKTYTSRLGDVERAKKAKTPEEIQADKDKEDEAKESFRIGTGINVEMASKINKMQPTQLSLTVQYVQANSGILETKLSLGIKTMAHVIPSEEFVKFLPRAKFDMSTLITLARVYTGELSFMKDFVLNLNSIRSTFTNKDAGTGGWYAKLKRLTSDRRLMATPGVSFGGAPNRFPTFSIAISLSDVQEMSRLTSGKFNITNDEIARSVVNSLSILNLIIVDEAGERVLWFDDAQQRFESYSLSELGSDKEGLTKEDLLKAVLTVRR
jgi:hypothetical protein